MRDQIGQTLGGPEIRPSFAARFEDLVEHLHLPSQSIPFELLNGVGAGTDRQVGDQLPIDLLSVFRRPALFGMDHRQGQSGIALLLSDRWQDTYLAIPDLKNGLVGIAGGVSDFDAMEPFDGDLVHFVGDRVIPVPSQAVDAGPDQEMSSERPATTSAACSHCDNGPASSPMRLTGNSNSSK
ncbi:hypothetical protein ACVWXN_005936 [Bradyrhizobium sp. i1.4.4]